MPGRTLRWIALVVGLVLVVVAGVVLEMVVASGHFRRIEPHFAGVCRPVSGLRGPEDITIHPRTGVAFVSAADRRAALAGRPTPGSIWAWDLGSESPTLRNLTPDADARFLPHGISLHVGDDGRDHLFVIDHRLQDDGSVEHRVEIFEVVDGELVHRRTIRDPALVSPNDLVAVGPDRFYVTNDHGSTSGVGRFMEDYLRIGGGGVVYYDGERFRTVASGIPYANGINVSADGRTLWVASTNTGRLLVFERDVDGGDLTSLEALDLGTGADNIELDDGGNLWIGSHPKLLDFVAHASDEAHDSPSQVIRISPAGSIHEVYLDGGDAISGSSVAAVWRDRLLIGAVFDPHFLDCRMTGGNGNGGP